MKLKQLSVLIAGALAIGAAPAQASNLLDYVIADGSVNRFEDQSREAFIDIDGNRDLSSGDVAVGFLRLDNRSLPNALDLNNGTELYAAFSVTVQETATAGVFATGETAASSPFSLTNLLGSPQPAGSIAGIYTNIGLDLVNTAPAGDLNGDGQLDFLDFMSHISGTGTLEVMIGLDAASGDDFFLTTVADTDLTQLNGPLADGFSFGDFLGGFSVLQNLSDVQSFEEIIAVNNPTLGGISFHQVSLFNGDQSSFAPTPTGVGTCSGTPVNAQFFFGNTAADTCDFIDLTGTSAALTGAGGVSYEFFGVTNNADASLAPIPNPATPALMAIGLLGAGMAARRGRRRS